MYRAYNLVNMPQCFYPFLQKRADNYATSMSKNILIGMKSFFLENFKDELFIDTLDADKLSNFIFPSNSHNQVFISHSHADIHTINVLAYLLYEKGITPFVDSHVWANMNDLLHEIDNEFCLLDDRRTYDYQKRNISTSHVHMLLFSALFKMINSCECFIFVDTQNSIQRTAETAKTFSPWIMGELLVSDLIKNNRPQRELYESTAGAESFDYSTGPNLAYRAQTEHLIKVNWADFQEWLGDSSKSTEALDHLYGIFL